MFEFYSDMKVTSRVNNTTFTSTPLHYVNLKKTDGGFIKAVFSKLDPTDNVDMMAMEQIKTTWNKYSSIPEKLYEDFSCPFGEEFYAIELINENDLSQKIVGLMSTDLYPKLITGEPLLNLALSKIAVKPEFSHEEKTSRKIEKIGELLFLEACEKAKKLKCDLLRFYSSNDAFYFKILKDAGLSENEYKAIPTSSGKICPTEFFIPQASFNKFIDYGKKTFPVNYLA